MKAETLSLAERIMALPLDQKLILAGQLLKAGQKRDVAYALVQDVMDRMDAEPSQYRRSQR